MLKNILTLFLIFRIAAPLQADDVKSFFHNDEKPQLVGVKPIDQKPPVTLELYETATDMKSNIAVDIKTVTKILDIGKHGWGTGFVVNGTTNTYVVTAGHVAGIMKPDDQITFGDLSNGQLVSKNKVHDLAVFSFDNLSPGVDVSTVDVQIGQKYTCYGAKGHLNRELTESKHTVKHIDKYSIYTDGVYTPGRSGAPLFDQSGKVVGVFCALMGPDSSMKPGEFDINGLQAYTKIEYLIPLLSPVQYKITMYSGRTCTFCKQQHEITDAENDKRVIFDWTYDKCPEWILRKLQQPYKLPVGVWPCGKNRYSWPEKSGVHTVDQFVEMLELSNAEIVEQKEPMAVGANTEQSCGALNVKPYMADIFNWYNKYLPVGVVGKLTWVRTGETRFNLFGGKKNPLNLEAVCGKAGLFEFNVNYPDNFSGEKLQIRHLKFGYSIDGDDIEFNFDNVKVFGLVKIIDGQLTLKMSNAEEPKGFISVMTLWTIVSTVHTLYVIFNPVADIVLGNNVGFSTQMLSPDNIIIQFTDMPSLMLISLMTFNLGLREINLTKEKVILKFTGSRLIKQYTLDIK